MAVITGSCFPVYPLRQFIYGSFLLHPGGLVQKSVALVKNTFIANIGYGLSANPQHNRIALKYQNNAFQIQLATLPLIMQQVHLGLRSTITLPQKISDLPGWADLL